MVSKATFETKDRGKIEVVRTSSADWSGTAYFRQQDYETEVNGDGEFKDVHGTAFRVLWPFSTHSDAVLDVVVPRGIGRAKVEYPKRFVAYA